MVEENKIDENKNENQNENLSENEIQQEQQDNKSTNRDYEKLKSEVEAQRELIRRKQAEVDRLNSEVNKVKSTPTKDEVKAPVPSDFNSDEDYLNALSNYNIKKTEIAIDEIISKKIAEKENKNLYAEHVQRFKDREKELSSKYHDYSSTVFADDVEEVYKRTPGLTELIISMPNNADIAYHLGSNIDKLRHISSLPYELRAAEIAKISHSLYDNRPKQNNPPPPINPLGQARVNTGVINPDDLPTLEAWEEWKNSQMS